MIPLSLMALSAALKRWVNSTEPGYVREIRSRDLALLTFGHVEELARSHQDGIGKLIIFLYPSMILFF
jgi:hypothetical protein